MAVKVNKEFLLKHRFWILTGVFVILALVPLFILTMSVSAEVDKKRSDYENVKKGVDGINSSAPNDAWAKAYQIQDDFVAAKKAEVHRDAWNGQKGLMTYPSAMVPIVKGKRFGDPIGFQDLDLFGRVYQSQLTESVIEVQPLLPREGFENGVVQFAGNDIDSVLHLGVQFTQVPPSKEDFWMAQEDLWIKRELLQVIRDANDLVARFHPVGESEPATEKKPADPAAAKAAPAEAKPVESKPADGAAPAKEKPAPKPQPKKPIDLNHRVFRNQHWQLDLTLKTGQDDKRKSVVTLSGTITNVGTRRRALGIMFKVFLQPGANASGIMLPVDREALAVGESWAFPPKTFSVENVAFDGLHGVEEVLTWRTAPVKRIDVVELGYESSRLAHRTLKPPRWYTPPAEPEPAAAGGEDGAGGLSKKMMMSTGGPGGGAGAAATELTKNGMKLYRYIDTNEQVRHMPVGMVVVADDEHLAELLSAFTNSRLHIQVTQCHWDVCREKLAPLSEETSSSGAAVNPGRGGLSGAGPGAPMMGAGRRGGMRGGDDMPGADRNKLYGGGGGSGRAPGNSGQSGMGIVSGQGKMLMQGMGGRSGMNPGMSGRPNLGGASDGEDEENLNLLEVAIYGIASIYEEFPPRTATPDGATADASGAAAQPGTQPKP